ncbi:bscl2 protein [Pelomyxa schiedti]|nr:bscl2 protein [Pelomyxa schiedti]
MVMPESPANVNLGMFMVSLDIQDHRGASVLHSARPSRIKYRTEPIRFLESMVQAIPIILGYMDQAQTLVIPLMEKAIEQDSHPFYKVTLQLSKPQIEVYSAELILTANLHGLAYFLYHYCYTTAIIIICAIFWTLFVFFLIAWIIILIDTWPATYAPFAGTGFALGGAGGGSGTGTGIGTTGTGTGTGTGIGDAFSYRRRDSEHHTHHIDESGNPPSSLRRRRRRVASAAHPSFSESAGGDISSTNSSSEEDDIPHTPTALRLSFYYQT